MGNTDSTNDRKSLWHSPQQPSHLIPRHIRENMVVGLAPGVIVGFVAGVSILLNYSSYFNQHSAGCLLGVFFGSPIAGAILTSLLVGLYYMLYAGLKSLTPTKEIPIVDSANYCNNRL